MNLSHAFFVIKLKGEKKRKNMGCDKFEKLFTQEDETELLEHIKTCEECRKQYEEFQKVSNLVKEAKPLFMKEKFQKRKVAFSMVAGVTILSLTGFLLLNWLPYYQYDQAIASDIYPTDEYGLLELY